MYYLPSPITEDWSKDQADKNKTPVTWSPTDAWTGWGEQAHAERWEPAM